MVKQFVKNKHILCEGCGSISVKNNCYVNISILKSRVKTFMVPMEYQYQMHGATIKIKK
jgi:hypothetical protein